MAFLRLRRSRQAGAQRSPGNGCRRSRFRRVQRPRAARVGRDGRGKIARNGAVDPLPAAEGGCPHANSRPPRAIAYGVDDRSEAIAAIGGARMPHFLLSYDLAPDYLERRSAFREAHLALAWEAADKG